MLGQNRLIEVADYNYMQNKVALVLGPTLNGGGVWPPLGYGQHVNSTQLSVNTLITHVEWNKLMTDLLTCYTWIIGPAGATALTKFNKDELIQYDNPLVIDKDILAYQTMVDYVYTNRVASILEATQMRTNQYIDNYNAEWNGTITQLYSLKFNPITIDGVNYSGADAGCFYFNTGSIMRFKASLAGGNNPGIDWQNLFTDMGEVHYGYNGATCTGTGTGSSIGWYNLTVTPTLVFTKTWVGLTDTMQYTIEAYTNATKDEIYFNISFINVNGTFTNNVTGTITSTLEAYHANSPVVIPDPTIDSTGAFTGGAVAQRPASGNWTITPDKPSVDEGSSVVFTVRADHLNTGNYYWVIVGAGADATGNFTMTSHFDNINVSTDYADGTVTGTVPADNLTDPGRSITLTIYPDSTMAQSLATSTVPVNDTSTTPPGIIRYLNAGTYTWTVLPGVTYIDAFLLGGGGGGSSQQEAAPQYGAAGARGKHTAVYGVAVTPGDVLTINVGAGGLYGGWQFDTGTVGLPGNQRSGINGEQGKESNILNPAGLAIASVIGGAGGQPAVGCTVYQAVPVPVGVPLPIPAGDTYKYGMGGEGCDDSYGGRGRHGLVVIAWLGAAW